MHNPFKLRTQQIYDNNRQGAMRLKMCNSGKNFLDASFNPLLHPVFPFYTLRKKVFYVFRGYKKTTLGGHELLAYRKFFSKLLV